MNSQATKKKPKGSSKLLNPFGVSFPVGRGKGHALASQVACLKSQDRDPEEITKAKSERAPAIERVNLVGLYEVVVVVVVQSAAARFSITS